jgi:hypothetical protein|nr:MAG TPA: hypothetical protein [Caudoviricetes sp.]
MAKYTINNKEVTKEEFDKQVFNGIEGAIKYKDPFFLDEVLTACIDMSKTKSDNVFEGLKFRNEKLSQEEKDKINELRSSITGSIHHTGGTIFEKIQDSTMGKHIDPFYMVDIKNIKSVEIPPIGFNIQDPLDAYNAITGHSTRHKCNPSVGWKSVPKKSELSAGKKETEGKLHYELSWEFIEEMAKRMANNKSDKYPLYNWKKPIDVEDLKDAINRHHIEVMKGNYKDGDEILGHVVAYACNAMMLWEQLRDK